MKMHKILKRLIWINIIFLPGVILADWSPEQQELILLSDKWIAAEVGHDRGRLEQIMDERFLSTFASSGKTIDRSAYIAWILKNEIQPFQVLNKVINIHGKSALVISTSTDHIHGSQLKRLDSGR